MPKTLTCPRCNSTRLFTPRNDEICKDCQGCGHRFLPDDVKAKILDFFKKELSPYHIDLSQYTQVEWQVEDYYLNLVLTDADKHSIVIPSIWIKNDGEVIQWDHPELN